MLLGARLGRALLTLFASGEVMLGVHEAARHDDDRHGECDGNCPPEAGRLDGGLVAELGCGDLAVGLVGPLHGLAPIVS